MPKTPDDIERLKSAWLDDGCWDIEDTEGFEIHRDELKAWREREEAKNELRALSELHRIAEREKISVADARTFQQTLFAESRSTQEAVNAIRHLYNNLGGSAYPDMDSDFELIVHHIAEVAEARIRRSLIQKISTEQTKS